MKTGWTSGTIQKIRVRSISSLMKCQQQTKQNYQTIKT